MLFFESNSHSDHTHWKQLENQLIKRPINFFQDSIIFNILSFLFTPRSPHPSVTLPSLPHPLGHGTSFHLKTLWHRRVKSDRLLTASGKKKLFFSLITIFSPLRLRFPVPTFDMLTTVCSPLFCEWRVVPRLLWSLPCDRQVQRCTAAFWSFGVALTMILLLTPVPSLHILQLSYFNSFQHSATLRVRETSFHPSFHHPHPFIP